MADATKPPAGLDYNDHVWGECIGKRIESARLVDNELMLAFTDGSAIMLGDYGQSCCERRWLTCDDDLSQATGDGLSHVTVDKPDRDLDSDNPHDVAFLRVHLTSGSVLVLCTHNEHNGYYGGFSLQARKVEARE